MLTHSVENRFISIILTVLVLVVTPLFILFFQLSEQRYAKDSSERNQTMLDANANAIAKSLWDYDVDSLSRIVEAMVTVRSVVQIKVKDTTGQISLSLPKQARFSPQDDVRIKAPIRYRAYDGLKTVGTIEMTFAKRSMFDGGFYGSWVIIAIFLLAITIAFATAIIGNRQMVIKPLLELTAAIEATMRLGSRHRVKWVSDDEMGALAKSFNEMQDELEREENELRRAHQRGTDIYNRTPAMLYSVDAADTLIAVSDHWLHATGYSRVEAIGRKFEDFVAEADRCAYADRHSRKNGTTVRFRCADGDYLDVLIRETTAAPSGSSDTLSLSVMTDVTELKAAEQRNHLQAITDHLTGLLNRQGFEIALGSRIAEADRDGTALACLFVDLDRFKWINDTLGHAVGDKVLQQVVERMRTQVGPLDALARLGGDEFAILTAAPDIAQLGVEVSSGISRVIDDPFEVDGHIVNLSTSIGIAHYPSHAQTAAELLQKSDLAMYAQKRNGKNGARLYDHTLADAAKDRARMEADIETALQEDWFEAFLQPIFSLSTDRIVGFEALMRMVHPEHGLIQPASIVRNAEETDAIARVGNRIFEKALGHLARFNDHPDLRDAYIAVNFSPLQFEPKLLDTMTAMLLRAGVSPDRIVIEITEAVLLHHNPVIKQMIEALSAAGYRLALDDFGTGYSSLSYLQRFPVDIIKIDQSFLRSLTEDEDIARSKSHMLIEGITTISHQMNCTVVAEGIEKPQQREILRSMGVDAAQGYLYGRPMPFADIIRDLVEVGEPMQDRRNAS